MIYWDMDGVLAVYDRDGYNFPNPKFREVGSHYFLDREPDKMAVKCFNDMYDLIGDQQFIITTVSPEPEIRNEQILDKIQWIMKYMPSFNIGTNFIAVTSDKRVFVTELRERSLTNRDVLIDDYNKNLYKWQLGGGTAVKYLNGQNSEISWPWHTMRGGDIAMTDQLFTLLKKIGF